MAFTTTSIELSMVGALSQEPLKAHLYTIETDTGEISGLSIGQLVMAICLQRATELEASIVEIMREMNSNTAVLEDLTAVEQLLVDNTSDTFDASQSYTTVSGTTTTVAQYLTDAGIGNLPSSTTWTKAQVDSVVSSIEDKMDSLNTLSQDLLIKLQSLTAKRDQTYDLVSNSVKSFNNVMTGLANNM